MGEVIYPKNLYVHFPFCRRKCTYCVLTSRAGSRDEIRRDYVANIASSLKLFSRERLASIETIYFGGGSPALCDLSPIFDFLRDKVPNLREFTIELHPRDVSRELMQTLRAGGLNRVSLGVQSLDDATLAHMNRDYTADDAERAFAIIKSYFDNAGIDLIAGYPVATKNSLSSLSRLANWGLTHASVYSLIWEEDSILAKTFKGIARSDDEILDEIKFISRFLNFLGLSRYEISNYSLPNRECKHNLATWNGEDYYGIGTGASGRLGLIRTQNWWGDNNRDKNIWNKKLEVSSVSRDTNKLERTLFRLRTRDGLNARDFPKWIPILDNFVKENLLAKREDKIYVLTERGTEVCDSILAELI